MIYSSLLFDTLRENHIPVRLINTNDLGYKYTHYFVIVPSNKEGYMLSDLTFSQFLSLGNFSDEFSDLLIAGYQKMDNLDLDKYLKTVTRENLDKKQGFDEIFYNKEEVFRRR